MIVPINDANALAKAIESLLANGALRKRLGQAARRTIIENFEPQRELEANLEVYRKLGIKPHHKGH
jgi:glycosyltransferase involved in cell wall biosynthesis